MKKRILLYLFAFALVFISREFYFDKNSDDKDFSKQSKIYLRQAANQLLLSNLDSTSLILPIKQLTNNKFKLSFQNNLLFHPDSLVSIVKRNVERLNRSENYRVEVLQCDDGEVAYSYEMNISDERTIIPCSGRVLPWNCYTVQIDFLDQKTSSLSWILYFLFFTAIILIEYLNKKNQKKKEDNEASDRYAALGSFLFYPQQNKLIKEAQEIRLSKKECELLEVFVSHPNQVIKREDITKKIWEDNGVFVGRSLDTYVSKLRKKLQDDDRIKIINLHGVGYKLEITS